MTAQNPAAGKPVDPATLVNVPRLVTAYFEGKPDAADPAQMTSLAAVFDRSTRYELAFWDMAHAGPGGGSR